MIITIGGVPAAGKTYTSKLLAEKLNCIAIEVEALRWDFFNENIEQNVLFYTNYEHFKSNESMREYYLRNTLFGDKISLAKLVEWHRGTIEYINNKLYDILNDFNIIKSADEYEDFCDKYKYLINFAPNYHNLNRNKIIFSHAFINVTDFAKRADFCFCIDASENILKDRFAGRENLDVKSAINLTNYFKSYRIIVEEGRGIKLDSTKKNIVDEIIHILESSQK